MREEVGVLAALHQTISEVLAVAVADILRNSLHRRQALITTLSVRQALPETQAHNHASAIARRAPHVQERRGRSCERQVEGEDLAMRKKGAHRAQAPAVISISRAKKESLAVMTMLLVYRAATEAMLLVAVAIVAQAAPEAQ